MGFYSGLYAVSVACGALHTCVIRNDSKVVCWGNNTYGQLGNGGTNHLGWKPGDMGENRVAVNLGSGTGIVLRPFFSSP
jgi:alpha-tubulin suppressor-like RCC1 family protein